MGGILAYAGVPKFLANLDEFYEEVDEDETAWAGFLTAWHERFGSEAVRVAEIKDALDDGAGELREALPGDLLEALEAQKGSFTQKLGTALAKQAGAVFGDFRLDRAGKFRRAGLWRVRLVSPVSHFRPDTESESTSGDVRSGDPSETDSQASQDSHADREPGEDGDGELPF